MSKPISIQDTIAIHPTGVASDHAYASISNQTNGYNNSSNTTYATINLTTGSGAQTYIYFTFDFSQIPAGATIDSVSCTAKAYINTTNSSRITSRQIQLYTGTTAKGSASTVSNSTTAFTMTAGTWTREELQSARIRLYAKRGTSNTTSTYYLRFYGATFTVNYSINGTAYTIGATSNVSDVTVEPATQDILSGNDVVVNIYAQSLDNITVTDNDVDVTNQLVQKQLDTSGTIAAVPASYTTSGSISGTRYQSTIGCGVDNPSSQTGNDYAGSNGSTATIYYHFNFENLPDNATITSMTVQAYGHLENASQYSEVAKLNTYSGTTAKGIEVSYTSSSSQTINISPGTWTVAELKNDPCVGFTIGYYGGLTTGITWTVNYTLPVDYNYYYEYALENVSTDHIILIDEAGAFIPPEEDPQKTYYSITISSINATTSPGSGTTRVQAGTNQTITITPFDPQLTLALDNGVDITSQLVGGVPQNTYTVTEKVSGATYGFNLNSSSGYYVSSNNGVSKSASVARVNMDFESDCLVTITYINYAEEDYDYGMFGKLDTAVATDGLTAGSGGSTPSDSTSNYQLAKCSNSSGTQTITYSVPAGEHFIDIKYGKDDASDSNNDSLQWKITSVQATSAGGDYTYTLTNIQQKHSLVFIFGNVSYYFITSSATGDCKLFPDGQMVELQGGSYSLTIVPTDTNTTVSILDNNINTTSALEYEQGQDKYGNKVVNYKYKLTNITATHNLVISCSGGNAKLYFKNNNSWIQAVKVYVKVNGSWVEQSNLENVFDSRINYIKGN